MGIVSDAGGYCSFAQAKALDEAKTNSTTAMMPLDDDQLEQVAGRIGHNLTVANGGLFAQVPGGNLAWLDTDHFDKTRRAWDTKVFFTQIADTYSAGDAGKLVSGQIYQESARVGYYLPILVDGLNLESLQIVQHHKVSNEAGGNCAAIIKPEI